MLEDAPDTYYVTDYYRPYPVVLVRLSHLNREALRDLLAVSWRMAMAKAPRRRRSSRPLAGAPEIDYSSDSAIHSAGMSFQPMATTMYCLPWWR